MDSAPSNSAQEVEEEDTGQGNTIDDAQGQTQVDEEPQVVVSTPTDEPEPVEPVSEPVVVETGEAIHLVNGPLWFRIISPGDGAVVSTPEVLISGEASDGTVLTVGEQILLVEGSPEFSLTMLLEEGTNMIEIVASDYAGNELSYHLVIIYENPLDS